MKKYIQNILVVGCLGLLMSMSSCSGFLEVEPSTEIPKITTVGEAQAALNGVYARMVHAEYYGADVITYGDVRGDDMATTTNGDRTRQAYEFGNLTSLTYTNVGNFWVRMYNALNRANTLISLIEDGVVQTKTNDEAMVLKNIKAQAIALRAFIHFDLLRIHGEPYLKDNGPSLLGISLADRVVSKDDRLERATVGQSYDFIIKNFKDALVLFGETATIKNDYSLLNVWATKSLLARVYLYKGDYENAYTLSKEVISDGGFSLISNAAYADSWKQDKTTESIFEVVFTALENAQREGIGYLFLPKTTTQKGYGAVVLSEQFIELMKEDMNDVRWSVMQKSDYYDNGYLAKYPGRDGNSYVNNARVVRLSDVYLMAAEAGVKSGKADASTYLNAIRKRANPALADVVATEELVEKERRKELVGEGHRYFDIIRDMRNGKKVVRKGHAKFPIAADNISELSWSGDKAYRMIMPIPQSEMELDGNKLLQNAKYPKVN